MGEPSVMVEVELNDLRAVLRQMDAAEQIVIGWACFKWQGSEDAEKMMEALYAKYRSLMPNNEARESVFDAARALPT